MANMGITCLALLQQAGTVPVAGDTDNRLTASNHDAL